MLWGLEMTTATRLDETLRFLRSLLLTPSPSGYPDEAIALVEDEILGLDLAGASIERTRRGALLLTVPGSSDLHPRAVAVHVDTLGAMVREVKSNGRLLLTQLGGYSWHAVEGENVTVLSVTTGERFTGTIQTDHPSAHTSRAVREAKREEDKIEVRLDIRSLSHDDTIAAGIEVGDFVFLDPRPMFTETGYVKSRHLDDKAGVAIAYGALAALSAGKVSPSQTTRFLFSVYEEVGHGAAMGIPSDTEELLVIDMAAATVGEHQNSDEYSVGICAKDSSGPYDLQMRKKLTLLCERNGIPYRVDTSTPTTLPTAPPSSAPAEMRVWDSSGQAWMPATPMSARISTASGPHWTCCWPT